MNKEQLIEDFVTKLQPRKEKIAEYVSMYESNPRAFRNKLAELGMETTPVELSILISFLRLVQES